MSFIQNKQNRLKIKSIFSKYSSSTTIVPNNKIKKFFTELGLASDLFFHDFYYYFPKIQKGGDLHYEDCLAFIDYILVPKKSDKEIVEAFKIFDRNGMGHISTTELLAQLRKSLPSWQFERYAQIISSYGSTINYIDLFQKNKIKY